jgi:hypothetical protein
MAPPRAEDYIGYAKNITFWDRELCRSLHQVVRYVATNVRFTPTSGHGSARS